MQPSSNPVFNSIPPAVLALAVVIGGLEIMFQLAVGGMLGGQGGVGWRVSAMQDFAVLNSVYEWMHATSTYPPEQLVRWITYPLLSGNWINAAFVVVFILALGKMVAEAFSQTAFLVIFWVSSVVAGLAFVIFLDSRIALIGGFPGAYGLIGAFTYIQWVGFQTFGGNQLQPFRLIAMLAGIQLFFSVINGDYGNLLADLTGFATGFLLSFVLRPGGWSALLNKLRQR